MKSEKKGQLTAQGKYLFVSFYFLFLRLHFLYVSARRWQKKRKRKHKRFLRFLCLLLRSLGSNRLAKRSWKRNVVKRSKEMKRKRYLVLGFPLPFPSFHENISFSLWSFDFLSLSSRFSFTSREGGQSSLIMGFAPLSMPSREVEKRKTKRKSTSTSLLRPELHSFHVSRQLFLVSRRPPGHGKEVQVLAGVWKICASEGIKVEVLEKKG